MSERCEYCGCDPCDCDWGMNLKKIKKILNTQKYRVIILL